jgi:hypothetical protein
LAMGIAGQLRAGVECDRELGSPELLADPPVLLPLPRIVDAGEVGYCKS